MRCRVPANSPPHCPIVKFLALRAPAALLDLEIAALHHPARDPGAVRSGAEVFQGQRVEPAHRLFLQFEPERPDHLMPERASRRVADRVLAGFELAYRAHDIAEADAAALAGLAIAAARTADPDEDLLAHQFLQHRFEITARDALALGDLGRTDRGGAPVIGDVEHRLDREQELLGEPDHESGLSPRRPVWTSRSDAGRAEAAFLSPARLTKRSDDTELGASNTGEDELRDTVARCDHDPFRLGASRVAVPRRDKTGALVIGIDDPDRVAEHQALA